jgi:hypothetical protein
MDKLYFIYLGEDGMYHAKFFPPISDKVKSNPVCVKDRGFADFLAATLVRNIMRVAPPCVGKDTEQRELFSEPVTAEEPEELRRKVA